MADDLATFRYSYVQTMVERIIELEAEVERLRAERDAERALADRLAVALAAQGSASFDEGTNLNIKRLALDAFKEARRG